jgi:hypothetical protein
MEWMHVAGALPWKISVPWGNGAVTFDFAQCRLY